MRWRACAIFMLGLVSLFLVGCDLITQILNPGTGEDIPWVIGEEVLVDSQTVGASGGSVDVSDPGGPLDGLEVSVPAGAYPTSKRFDISYSPVSDSIAPDFNPLTPLITVDNGDDYAEEVVTVTIPVELPEGHFAMGFFVGPGGELEGMPLIELTDNKITVGTMHFSSFIIASTPELTLTSPSGTTIEPKGVVDSGFRPMVDDWQFPNYGSYVADGGHCAGQALSALWYYNERTKKGTSSLYGRFDNNGDTATPDLWEDDSYGYRLASTVQEDITWSSRIFHLFEVMGATADATNWKAFLYSIRKTEQPQMVGIYDVDQGGGHAMIVYKVDTTNGYLHVADPNYPGNTGKKIEYASHAFKPYISGGNLADIEAGKGKSFERIWYFGRTAYVPWGKIRNRWSEFDAGTIGNGVFPAYELKIGADPATATAIGDEMTVSGNSVKVFITSTDPSIRVGYYVYRGDQQVQLDTPNTVTLSAGENDIGFYIVGKTGGGWEYVDFRRVNFRTASAGYAEISVSASAHFVYTPHDPEIEGSEHDSDGWGIHAWSLGSRSLGGNTYTATWSNVSPDGVLAPRSGSMTITFDSAMTEVVGFAFNETVHYSDTNVTQSYNATGAHLPLSWSDEGTYSFQVGGAGDYAETCDYLTGYGWAQTTPGGVTGITGWWCGSRAQIQIHYYETKPQYWPEP